MIQIKPFVITWEEENDSWEGFCSLAGAEISIMGLCSSRSH